MNKEDIEYYTFQYTIPVYKIKPPQKFNEYYQTHKDEIIVELDKENKRLKQKVNQLETNRDEVINIIENHIECEKTLEGMLRFPTKKIIDVLGRGKE